MRKIRLSKVGAALIVALFLLPPAMIVLSSFMSDRDLDKIYADGAAFCPIPREATLSGYCSSRARPISRRSGIRWELPSVPRRSTRWFRSWPDMRSPTRAFRGADA